MARMSEIFERLQTDIVLVVGDRVEAFAGAAAGHIGGRIVAHVHGGDRALGQVDDSLRHAITKLAHLHLVSHEEHAARVIAMGEDPGMVHVVGAPGLDALARADLPDRAALEADLTRLIQRFNRATDGGMVVPSEYLETVITLS